MAEVSAEKKPRHDPIYDDKTIENMLRYYQLQDYAELLKYIKKIGIPPESD